MCLLLTWEMEQSSGTVCTFLRTSKPLARWDIYTWASHQKGNMPSQLEAGNRLIMLVGVRVKG